MKLKYQNTAKIVAGAAHGTSTKTLVVLHETVSPDIDGWADINGVEQYLASKGYGIHGMTDREGNIAWALGLGKAVFWQAGGVNLQSIGIEQVSPVPSLPTLAARKHAWANRGVQLKATAKLLAAISKAHGIPLVYTNGHGANHGVTSHWDVSQFHPESQGHTDCWPVSKGGYYPIDSVLVWARKYAKFPYSYKF